MLCYYCRPNLMGCGKSLSVFVTGLLFFLLAASATFDVLADNSKKVEISFGFYDKNYKTLIYVPAKPEKSYPLLIVAPGAGDRLPRFVRATNFNKMAGKLNFVVVFPQLGQRDNWVEWISAPVKNVNKAAEFFRALIESVSSEVRIDSKQIFLAGFSGGGMLVLTAMCDMSSEVAAIGVVAASLPKAWQPGCSMNRAVPAIFFAGREDSVIPWDGGQISNQQIGVKDLGVLSVTHTVDFWRSKNNCNARPLIKAVQNVDTSDRTTVTRLSYDFNCRNSAHVLLYAIKGGGHSWPGSMIRLRSFQGAISQDIQASDIIWDFVKKYRLNGLN